MEWVDTMESIDCKKIFLAFLPNSCHNNARFVSVPFSTSCGRACLQRLGKAFCTAWLCRCIILNYAHYLDEEQPSVSSSRSLR